VWRVRFRCIYLRVDDFGAFMCEGRILVNMMFVHLPELRFAVHSCVRGRIPVHLLEGWWFRCIHVWRVGYWCIYLRSDDLRCIYLCEVKIPVHLLEGWLFRCIHVWGVGFWCIYLMIDDIGAFMCVRGKIPVHLPEGWWLRCIHVWGVGYPCIYLSGDDLQCIHVWRVRFWCIYQRDDDVGAFMCEG